ncbi:MAG TPA: hypothetical protein VF487_13210 [Chitinophagaceae bacterium]
MEKKLSNVEPAVAANAFNDLLVKGNSSLTYEEAFDLLDRTDDKMLVTLGADYFKFETIGQVNTFVVLAMDKIELKGKEVDVVRLQDREGKVWIAGDSVLVSSCEKLKLLPAWIKVTYNGDKKNTQGTYKDLTVKTFPVN